MKNVYYLSANEDDASAFYRTSGTLPYLDYKKVAIKNIFNAQKTYGWEHLLGADVFIFQRPYHEYHTNLIKMAKDMGIRVICEYDDDLLHVPIQNSAHDLLTNNRHNIIESIMLADEVWVSTISIKDSFARLKENIFVIPNAHNDYIFPIKNKRAFNRDTKIAAYRGGSSHNEDVYGYKDDIINAINENTDWEFRFQGSRFPFIERDTKENHTYTNPMSLMQFFNSYHDLNPNIAFFPLENSLFNNAKSNISFLEATYSGAVFFGNTNMKEFQLPFIQSIQDGFKNKFESYKDDYDYLENMNKEAWQWVLENRLLSNVNDLRLQRILS